MDDDKNKFPVAVDPATISPVRSIIGQHPRPRGYANKPRPAMVNGITIHQTGCNMPANINGWARLNAHMGITTEGMIYWVNNPIDFIWHAQGLSPLTIGIEVEGNWYGIEGNPKTLWKGGGAPAKMNDKIDVAIREALDMCYRWIMAQAPVNKWERLTNAKPTFKGVYAHRQSSDTRLWDPGQAIYKIAHQFNVLKKTTDCEYEKFGDGSPITLEWVL